MAAAVMIGVSAAFVIPCSRRGSIALATDAEDEPRE